MAWFWDDRNLRCVFPCFCCSVSVVIFAFGTTCAARVLLLTVINRQYHLLRRCSVRRNFLYSNWNVGYSGILLAANQFIGSWNPVCCWTEVLITAITKGLLNSPTDYFYSKTNHMHSISNLFYFGTTLHMFRRSLRPSSGVLRLYIQHQVYVT
jgi:hypothetical protein